MRILFVKGRAPLSKAIIGVTKEPVSHCALLFEFGLVEFVIHADLYGTHIVLADNFRQHCDIIKEVVLTQPTLLQELKDKSKLIKLLTKHEFSLYDFGALIFVALALLARRFLKIPLPKSNLWQSTGMDLCTEWIQRYVDGKIDSMITPYQLYLKLINSGEWRDYVQGNEEA